MLAAEKSQGWKQAAEVSIMPPAARGPSSTEVGWGWFCRQAWKQWNVHTSTPWHCFIWMLWCVIHSQVQVVSLPSSGEPAWVPLLYLSLSAISMRLLWEIWWMLAGGCGGMEGTDRQEGILFYLNLTSIGRKAENYPHFCVFSFVVTP